MADDDDDHYPGIHRQRNGTWQVQYGSKHIGTYKSKARAIEVRKQAERDGGPPEPILPRAEGRPQNREILKDPISGKFLKGNGMGGRKKGSKNKIQTDIRTETYEGLAAVGSDGRGKDGFKGYVAFLGRNYPESAAMLIGKMMPKEITADITSGSYIGQVNIVKVPPGHFVTKEYMDAQRPQLEPRDIVEIEAVPLDDYVPPEPAPNVTKLKPWKERE